MLSFGHLLISLVSLANPAEGGTTGIFLTIECRKDIERKHEMLSTKMVCITQNPILSPKDFASISAVRDNKNNIYFDITFTYRGHQTLIKLTENLPDSQLALVVSDEVFFVFKSNELKVAPTFRFQTVSKFRAQVEAVHRRLLEAKEASARDL